MSVLRHGGETIYLGRPLRVDRRAALDRLREIGRDRGGMADLRRLLARELGRSALHLVRDDQVLAQLAERVAAGTLTVALVRTPMPGAPPLLEQGDSGAAEEPPPADEAAAEQATTFIELKIVLASGEPVASVRIEVTLPSGEVQDLTTDSDGVARIEPVDPGACDARSPWKGNARAETLAIAGSGAGGGEDDQASSEGSGSLVIATVERHKVQTGETLAGLAESVGLTWQELARFNFGTDKPEEINRALRRVVGCTRKTKDKKNYVFDDADDPGILLLPKAWEQAGLATGSQHVLTVEPVAAPSKARPWRFSV